MREKLSGGVAGSRNKKCLIFIHNKKCRIFQLSDFPTLFFGLILAGGKFLAAVFFCYEMVPCRIIQHFLPGESVGQSNMFLASNTAILTVEK
jgi:hypothetical protein